jgi:hypothetical protein
VTARFYVRDSATGIRVVDRDYDHRTVRDFSMGGGPRSERRRLAAIRCAELNAWHREQMQDVA